MKEYHFSSAFDEAVISSPTGFTSTAHFSLWKPNDPVTEDEEASSQNQEEEQALEKAEELQYQQDSDR